jgi:selenocysteine lyase/cysteine desulfurase
MAAGALSRFVGNADLFPVLRQWHFFNHAGVAPISRAAADAMRKFAREAEADAYLAQTWYRDIELLRQEAAHFINAGNDEIAFVRNTSEGLSIVANGIDWQYGDRIITTNVEYPANIYPWMEAGRNRGTNLIMVPEEQDEHGHRHVPVDKILAAASEPRTKLVTLSHVEYASGQRHDLARIGKFCRERHILFNVDAIQSLGTLPIDVQAMHIDFLSADGHKWLLGPEGAGLFYIRRELVEHVRPTQIGWMNVVDAQNYGDYNYTLKADATRFECGSHNVAGLLGLRASLALFSVIGVENVMNRIKGLTDRLIEGLEFKGYTIVSPRGIGRWSGIVSFSSPTHSHKDLATQLRASHRIEIAIREGWLRASPHFYNTDAQIDRLIDALPGH